MNADSCEHDDGDQDDDDEKDDDDDISKDLSFTDL